MTIQVHCDACDYDFKVEAVHAGKLIRCPSCRESVRVPKGQGAKPAAAAAKKPRPQPRSQQRPAQRPQQRSAPAVRSQPAAALPRKSRASAGRRSSKKRSQSSSVNPKIVAGVAGAVVGVVALILVVKFYPSSGDNDQAVAESKPVAPTIPQHMVAEPPVEATYSSDNSAVDSAVASTTPVDAAPVSDMDSSSGMDSESPFQPVPETVATMNSSPAAQPNTGTSSEPAMSGVKAASTTQMSWADLNEHVEPCVVRVDVRSTDGEGNGSGFVVDSAGFAVTNYHVVEGLVAGSLVFANDDRLKITGFAYLDADRDIAIVTFDPAGASQPIKALPLTTVLPRKGEEVAAFGAPYGLDFTFTQSTVSANRTAEDLQKIGASNKKGSWIQHSAPISAGNSGGPLVNTLGEVVAINTMILTIGQNLNFAISALDIQDAMGKRLPRPLPAVPSSAPMIARAGSRPPSGGASPFVERRKEALDLTDDPRGTKMLAGLKDVSVLILSFSLDVRGTVTGAVRKSAYDAVERSKLKVKSFNEDRALLLIGMALERSGSKSSLRMTATLLMKDGRDVVKLWEETDDVGTISEQSLMLGRLPPNLRKDITDYFSQLRSTLARARRSQAALDKSAATGTP